jgi:ferredoxin
LKKGIPKGGILMDFRYREILTGDGQLGPYPLEKLPRVETATTHHTEKTRKRSLTEAAFMRAERGEYGQAVKEGSKKFMQREPILASLTDVHFHLARYQLPEMANEKAPLPGDPLVITRHIKSMAYFLGADMVGVCRLPQSAVYSSDKDGNPIEANYKYAVVVLNVKDTSSIRASYGREWIDDPLSFQVYQQCGIQCLNLAGYILRLGYPAFPSIVGTYKNLMTPLIIESGLGEGSRIGIAVNPFVGASFKVAAVLTDLPLVPDKPIDFGLQKYCAECKICAEQCPMHAVSDRGKETYNGYETYRHNFKLCYTGIMTNPVGNYCQRCTKTCPWNRPDNKPEDFKNWDGNLQYLYDSVERQARRMRENNFIEPTEYKNKWWFPLENKNGELTDAPEWNYDNHFARMKQVAKKKEAGENWSVKPDWD